MLNDHATALLPDGMNRGGASTANRSVVSSPSRGAAPRTRPPAGWLALLLLGEHLLPLLCPLNTVFVTLCRSEPRVRVGRDELQSRLGEVRFGVHEAMVRATRARRKPIRMS